MEIKKEIKCFSCSNINELKVFEEEDEVRCLGCWEDFLGERACDFVNDNLKEVKISYYESFMEELKDFKVLKKG